MVQCGRQMCNCSYKLSCKLSHLVDIPGSWGWPSCVKCLQWMHEDLISNPQHPHKNCDSCTCDFTTGGTKMGFPAPLVLTGQQAIQISQLQLQWDTLSQKLKWFPLASTVHICIHVLLNIMHIQKHTLAWICTCHIPHMHGNTCSKFGLTFRQPGSSGDEFCPDVISHIKGRTSDLPGMHEM